MDRTVIGGNKEGGREGSDESFLRRSHTCQKVRAQGVGTVGMGGSSHGLKGVACGRQNAQSALEWGVATVGAGWIIYCI